MKPLRETVAELRRLCETATAAPWVHGCDEDPPLEDISAENGGGIAVVFPHAYVPTVLRTGEHFSHSDARLIVAARNGLGQLLDAADENERLRALLGEARDALQWENPYENAELIERLNAELDK